MESQGGHFLNFLLPVVKEKKKPATRNARKVLNVVPNTRFKHIKRIRDEESEFAEFLTLSLK